MVLVLVPLFQFVLDLDQVFQLSRRLPVAAGELGEGGVDGMIGRAVLLVALAAGDFGELGLHGLDLCQAHVHRIEMFDHGGVHIVLLRAGEGGEGVAYAEADGFRVRERGGAA